MNQPDLGEQAISKAAEIGLKSQLDAVENLDIDIRANPLDLAQGKLEAVTIDGKGMVMQKELRAERLVMQTDSIAIDTLKAALGNIELTQTTDAESKIVLLEADIQQAFNSEYIQNKLKNQKIELNGEIFTVNAHNVQFTLPSNQQISLTADIDITETSETKPIALSAKPDRDANGRKIVLKDVAYDNDEAENLALAEALLNSTQEILDLRNFELEGISLQIQRLEIAQGKMIIAASAVIQEFPSD
jgi:hypothetical protein